MNLQNNPDLLERLGAAHALGTVRGPARRRFEARARNEPRLRAASLPWRATSRGYALRLWCGKAG